jgi:hypothetical protein
MESILELQMLSGFGFDLSCVDSHISCPSHVSCESTKSEAAKPQTTFEY